MRPNACVINTAAGRSTPRNRRLVARNLPNDFGSKLTPFVRVYRWMSSKYLDRM